MAAAPEEAVQRTWLAEIAAGDERAMHSFYECHAQAVYSFALRRLDEPADAADLLHEVMLEVWQKAGRYQGRSRVRTWLLGIANHKILDRLRALGRARERADTAEPDSQAQSSGGALAALTAAAETRWIRHCLERLSAIHRQVMHLAFFQELSYPEIAEILGCPPGTVKTRMMHARSRMKHCLEALGLAPAGF